MKERCGGWAETFVDAVNGIRVTVNSATATGYVVTIWNYIPLSSVEVSGPAEGLTDEEYAFSHPFFRLTRLSRSLMFGKRPGSFP